MYTNTLAIRPGTRVYSILKKIFCFFILLLVLAVPVDAADIPIVVSDESRATVQIGANASTQERFAASEIQAFIEKWTGAQLELRTNQQSTTCLLYTSDAADE